MAMENTEDWRKCLDWFKRCQVITPKDNPLFRDQVQVYELSNQMRYGVIICHLLNRLCPGAIDNNEFSARPQSSQFLCLKNIRIFLATCKRVFNLEEGDLFEQYDLFNTNDFAKVIKCLSVLSNTAVAAKSSIVGFKLNSITDEEDTYGCLKDFDETQEEEEEDIYSIIDNQSDDKIYEDLCSIRARRSMTTIIEVPKTKRDMVINELVTTEYNFLNQLKLIIKHHLIPMKEVMTPKDHEIVFRNIESLEVIHSEFYTDLALACTEVPTPKNALKPLRGAGGKGVLSISECFSKYKSAFTIYGNYCTSLKKASDVLENSIKSDSNLALLIQKCEHDSHSGKFRLRDLLNVPMQRILKYHLLIENLVKETDGNEKENMRGALSDMRDIATYINEVKRDVENIETLKNITKQIHNMDMSDPTKYGKYLCDATIRIRDNKETKAMNRLALLFDKAFILVKLKIMDSIFWDDGYDFKKILYVKPLVLSIIPESQVKNEKWGYQFLLTDKTNNNTYTIYNKTKKEYNMFINNFTAAISNNCPPGYLDNGNCFIFTTFSQNETCMYCHKFLYGLMYQGYLCKNTNTICHKNCIPRYQEYRLSKNLEDINISKESLELKKSVEKLRKAKVIQDYTPSSSNYRTRPPDDLPALTLTTGDIIDILETSVFGWWKGRHNGFHGWFPQKNVHIITTNQENKRSDSTTSASFPVTPQYLVKYPWFMSDISRKTASDRLLYLNTGTFMVRSREEEYIPYAISINYNNSVKHIKVQMNTALMYYIADVKHFSNIMDLVTFYEQNTLEKSFPGLETTLKIPYKTSTSTPTSADLYEVMYDFKATQANQLTLSKGDIVKLISNDGDDRGWWKGSIDGQVGFFPLQYVKRYE